MYWTRDEPATDDRPPAHIANNLELGIVKRYS